MGMSEAVVELEPGAVVQFTEAVKDLRALGEAASKEDHRIREEYGSAVAEDMIPDTPADETAAAFTRLLGVIPGVELDSETSRTMAGHANRIGSSYQVAATMRASDENEVSAYVAFDKKYIVVGLERSAHRGPGSLRVELRFTPQAGFLGGTVRSGNESGKFQGLRFDREASVITSRNEDESGNQKLDLTGLLHSITTAETLNQPLNVAEVLTEATLGPGQS